MIKILLSGLVSLVLFAPTFGNAKDADKSFPLLITKNMPEINTALTENVLDVFGEKSIAGKLITQPISPLENLFDQFLSSFGTGTDGVETIYYGSFGCSDGSSYIFWWNTDTGEWEIQCTQIGSGTGFSCWLRSVHILE